MIKYPGSIHNHTQYSNSRWYDCTIRENKLIEYAVELGHSCVAITDHDSLSAAVKVEEARDAILEEHPDFKVIQGNEIYLCRNGLNADNYVAGQDKFYHFILLAKDLVGFRQLCEISTKAWTRSYVSRGFRRIPTYFSDLEEVIGNNPGHIVASTACLGGELASLILDKKYAEIDEWLKWMLNLFGDDFYLEMQPSTTPEQVIVNQAILDISQKTNIPFIIATDSHYLSKEDRDTHRVFLKSQNGEREVDAFYSSTYLMSDDDIRTLMTIGSENIEKAYKSIQEIADKCENYSIKRPLRIPELKWRVFPQDPNIAKKYIKHIPTLKTFLESTHKADVALVWAIIDRLEREPKLQYKESYDEINENLLMIKESSEVNQASWAAYLLNLQKVIDECWNAGTYIGAGRGSAGGFYLNYLLEITQVNPLWEKTQLYSWRFLNPARVSVLDVDIDLESSRREEVLEHLRETYNRDRVANVATFRTAATRAAIKDAARGLGIDSDVALYITSLIPSDRGILRTLDQCYYGDEEEGYKPVTAFVQEMKSYPELWKVARDIEGLVTGYGVHAGGVIFVDEPFTDSTALMRAPDGTLITQFELNDCEKTSLIKYDLLSVQALDKLHNCIDLLIADGFIEAKPTVRETYEEHLGVYSLERTAPEMWQMCWEHKINSLFQMEERSGRVGIEKLRPHSVDELAVLNSAIRLMPQERGGEMPVDKLVRFKNDPKEWDDELKAYGLGAHEKELLNTILSTSFGMCITQEQFMRLVQMPEIGGFDLEWSDRLRKSVAKKSPKDFEQLQREYFINAKEKSLDMAFCEYVWKMLIMPTRGYGFNFSHTLSYSIIGLQEMNLAYHYPSVFWNCACLISDSGGAVEFEPSETTTTVDYGKMSTALGKMRQEGISISPPDINKSRYSFRPDYEEDAILFGLKGITRVGDPFINTVFAQRPYKNLEDLLKRAKPTKLQAVNLIKSGALDCFGNRIDIMRQYISIASEPKKRLTLQNMQMLVNQGLLPQELDFQSRIFMFTKYIRKMKNGAYYKLDDVAFSFYEEHFDIDNIIAEKGIEQKVWDKIYSSEMDKVRTYIKENQTVLLAQINQNLFDELWDKYCSGSISTWEMDSLSCYIDRHELDGIDISGHNITSFSDVPTPSRIARYLTIRGKVVPIYELSRIIGTVLDKNKNHQSITLLTTDGVVNVKLYGVFAHYDRQLSAPKGDGTKTITRRSEFTRGNIVIVTGVKDGESEFRGKTYARTPYHTVETAFINEEGKIEIDNREE